jgi:hypothetical protein
MPMDSSLQSAKVVEDDLSPSLHHYAEGVDTKEEPHIHLPNPSWWPLILTVAIVLAVAGLLYFPENPWVLIISTPLILLGIMGWALEDPMASSQEHVISVSAQGVRSRFSIGQDVVDCEGNIIGPVEARFNQYLLVNIGSLVRPAYIPLYLIDTVNEKFIRLSIGGLDIRKLGLQNVPDNLYDEEPEYGVPTVTGVPQFASGPLSPAETGHYNYGPNFPGINTDAGGSYLPGEVRPTPQRYVSSRRHVYANRKPVAPQMVSAN